MQLFNFVFISFLASERGLTQKKTTSSEAVSKSQKLSSESILQSSTRDKANGLHQLHDSQSDPVSALNKDNQTSRRLENGLAREDEDTSSERRAKKRDIEEMFGPMSDSEDELVIDAPLPTLSKKKS